MPNLDLAGRRVLVVEDDYLLGADIADEIMSYKGVVLGPAMTLDAGAKMFRSEKPDACILSGGRWRALCCKLSLSSFLADRALRSIRLSS